MTATPRLALALAAAAAALAACSTDPGPAGAAGCPPPPVTSDGAVPLPTWQLEDIQPASPRAGQTYGLDTFSGKVVVVTLVEGY
jgi:hypothetical protein